MTGPATISSHRLGPVEEIPLGEGRAYRAGGVAVAVFRLRDGGLRAVAAVCPHAGGPLADGQADPRVVVCPLHLHAFDLATGRSPTGAPPVAVYPVRTDPDGHLVVEVPDHQEAP
jgi:nitrite reductase/ring-hydroxylating ferredoxin subunit